MTRYRITTVLALVLVACPARLLAHNGPPFPIVSDQVAGPYLVSIWTDPDTTDDGSPGGQFWVRIHLPGGDQLVGGREALERSSDRALCRPRTDHLVAPDVRADPRLDQSDKL